MFYQFWKFKLDTLIINNFIIENILYGMVTPRSLRRVLWRSTTSLFFNVTLSTLIHFWLGIQKSYTNFNNLFFSWISNLPNWWVKLAMFYKKMRVKLNHISITDSKSSVFPTFTPRHVKRKKTTQWSTARIIDFKHISPLCLSTLCHGKQVIRTY